MTKRTKKNGSVALVDLSTEEVRHLSKPRDGFEQFVEPMLALYQAHRRQLGDLGATTNELRKDLSIYEELSAREAEAHKELSAIEDTRRVHGSKVWDALLDIYARAQAAGRTSIEVKRAIAEFAQFMSTGPRDKIAQPAPAANSQT